MRFEKIKYNKNDEYYTPAYAVEPLIKYLKPNSLIWCPFDLEKSYFVKIFKEQGHRVINTHIDNGQDFFELDYDCDYIISNPPYSLKYEVFSRLFELKNPFAMLIGIHGLFDNIKRFELFKNNKFEILYMHPRVNFFQEYSSKKEVKNVPFQSVYICHNILPEQSVFENINKNRR